MVLLITAVAAAAPVAIAGEYVSLLMEITISTSFIMNFSVL